MTALIPEMGEALTEAFSILSGFAPDGFDNTSPSVVYPSVHTCTRVRQCVEPIFLANRLSNCWLPVAKSSMVLFSLYWQERTLLTNDFCFSPNGIGQLLFCGSLPVKQEFLHQSRKVKRFAGKCSSYSS